MINRFKQFLKEDSDTIYFTFGRFNPPTIGHEKLLDALAKKAGSNPYQIHMSQTNDKKKNPLSFNDKIKYSRMLFPKHARAILNKDKIKTVFDIAVKLYKENYKNIIMVVGSDRVNEFDILLNKYNGKEGKIFYNFKSIKVISAGDRDPDADGAEGMSASKMRKAAADNDFASFMQGIPNKVKNPDAKKLYNAVRKGMGLKEETTFKNHIDLGKFSDEREAFIKGDLFDVGDTVVIKNTDQIGIIETIGSNYVIVEMAGNKYRKWITDVERVTK